VQNPVSRFPEDNNGVVIDLPTVPSAGAASVTGSLILGIGTRDNNDGPGPNVITLTDNGTFTTLFEGRSVEPSFMDSGSNAIFFLDPATTGIPACADEHGFYCPDRTTALSATLRGATSAASAASFTVANADTLFTAAPDAVAFADLAGPSPGIFDWGLSFFYGRRVFTAIEGQSTPAGTGPYVAY
jgi:hypothetical protein